MINFFLMDVYKILLFLLCNYFFIGFMIIMVIWKLLNIFLLIRDGNLVYINIFNELYLIYCRMMVIFLNIINFLIM